ncbi:Ethanolamine ammonia-lyase light chain [Propionispora hippei DSM 15287]|uniref:Ethanolamine ammonia-lyase small subunit n=2 Tax=Propionispora TaxID=112902 RepID=A0A1M6EJX8_9FIRM|nr:Ethanolamine ammonia-lyase light chain [Propionispora hippei DSM 15287]
MRRMKQDEIQDIAAIDYTDRVTIDQPYDYEICRRMKKTTNSRICIGRAADRFKTETLLRFRADHAVAVDSVWSDVDEALIDELGFFKVQTLVRDKEEYITRPDLGRLFSEETLQRVKNSCVAAPEVQILVADGLSSHAITANIGDIYPVIVDGLTAEGYRLGTPIFIKYGRVATMDKISQALAAKVTILLIGERPGLATGESMSSYLAYEASPLKPEHQRNVISNIYKKGTPPVEAGAQIVQMACLMMKEKKSGIELKL